MAGGGGRSQAEVACAWMDGRHKAALWARATLPVSLAFSDDGATVYWADSGELRSFVGGKTRHLRQRCLCVRVRFQARA